MKSKINDKIWKVGKEQWKQWERKKGGEEITKKKKVKQEKVEDEGKMCKKL